MVAGVGRMRLALLGVLCALCASAFTGLGATAASASSVNAIVTASDCEGSSCSNFQVSFWGPPIRPYQSGKVCFKGKCLKTKSDSVGLFTANFNSFGPYSSGSKAKPSLSYKGRSYKRQVWINCGC